MDKEKIFMKLEQKYISKREMASRLPLGINLEAVWSELLNRRKSRATVLPLNNPQGLPYWFVTTEKMISASEKIIEELYELDMENTEFDPYLSVQNLCTLEEAFYTSFVEGSAMTMQEAMAFIQSESPPKDMEEQLIVNNRNAGGHAAANLYRTIDEQYLKELSYILTDGLDDGGRGFRTADWLEIPSMQDEKYDLPSASTLPDRAEELEAYLTDPVLHPLIKAAVAQAWVLAARPFTDGNERLGRMLSYIILIRAGYTFFSDTSISALIARRSYAYFEAIANTLRPENGSDLTYFVEYYIELLARAVEERKLKKIMKHEQDHIAEMEMARAPIAPSPPSVIIDTGPRTMDTQPYQKEKSREQETGDDPDPMPEGFDGPYNNAVKDNLDKLTLLIQKWIDNEKERFTVTDVIKQLNGTEKDTAFYLHILENNGVIRTCSRKKEHRTYMILWGKDDFQQELIISDPIECLRKGLLMKSVVMTKVCRQLIIWVREGIEYFRIDELSELYGFTGTQMSKALGILSSGNVIDFDSMEKDQFGKNYKNVYRIYFSEEDAVRSGLYNDLYDRKVLLLIAEMRENMACTRAKRLGDMLQRCLEKTEIAFKDYHEMELDSCWSRDIGLGVRMGLLEYIEEDRYRIRFEIKQEIGLTNNQKLTLTEIYRNFGFADFSKEMIIAKLDCPQKQVRSTLNELLMLRVVECTDDKEKKYRLLVTPEKNPEYFDMAV